MAHEDEREIHRLILEKLEQTYYYVTCGLDYSSPFELLVATMLSAQSTDKQVNKVTAKLFAHYNTPSEFAAMPQRELEEYIHSCGYYSAKAKNIIATSKLLIERFDGKVPKTMEELISLPGVGRKTANVVLANAFGQDAIAVDTHVFRVANRLGLAHAKDVEKTEIQLMQNIPKEKWSMAHHWLIWHGRLICSARRPKCEECPLRLWCEYGGINKENIGQD